MELLIPMSALSVNHSHMNAPTRYASGYKTLRNGGRIKTKETRSYEQEFCQHLLKYTEEIKEFLCHFDPHLHSIQVQYIFFFHRDKFYTKKGRLNMRCGDTDNMIKICQDLVFKNITNDAHIVDIHASRRPTNQAPFIVIRTSVVDLPKEIYCPLTTDQIDYLFPTFH